ncbi:MAG: DUF4401 domain-containing protein [Gammaproteobacteria bacterium]|nr:DUF4401 domain-containing protein [Gammaproteobacteria bacterium]
MTTGRPIIIDQFVQQVRNQLWIGHILKTQAYGLWACGLLTLTTGLAHLVLPGLYHRAILIPLSLPLLLCFGYSVVRQRPTPERAAHTADRLAGAESLLLSAWDIQRNGLPTSAAALLVIERAQAALPAWTANLRAGKTLKATRFPKGALAMTLAGAALLSWPNPPVPGSGSSASPKSAAFETQQNPLAAVLESLPAVSATHPATPLPQELDSVPDRYPAYLAETSPTSDAIHRARSDDTPIERLGQSDIQPPVEPTVTRSSPLPGSSSTENSTQTTGNDRPGNDHDSSSAEKQRPETGGYDSPPVRFEPIDRHGEGMETGNSRGLALTPTTHPTMVETSEPFPPSAAVTGANTPSNRYNPGQRAYIARYFHQMRTDSTLE